MFQASRLQLRLWICPQLSLRSQNVRSDYSSHSEGQIATAKVEPNCPGRKIPKFSLSLSRHFGTLNTELSCRASVGLPKLSLCSAYVLTLPENLWLSKCPMVTIFLHFGSWGAGFLPNSRLFFQNLTVQIVRLESRSGTKHDNTEKCKMTRSPWHHILTQELV